LQQQIAGALHKVPRFRWGKKLDTLQRPVSDKAEKKSGDRFLKKARDKIALGKGGGKGKKQGAVADRERNEEKGPRGEKGKDTCLADLEVRSAVAGRCQRGT